MVELLSGEKIETRAVQTDSSNDQLTQITSGLVEGEMVVIPTTSTTQPRNSFAPAPGAGFGGPGGATFVRPAGR